MKKLPIISSMNNDNSIIEKNLIDINNMMRKTNKYKFKVVKVICNKTNNTTPL